MVNQTVQLEPEQISRIIRSQIKYYQNAIEQTETGTVTMVGDGIARAAGLDNCMAGELVQFDSGTYGMAQNLEENSVSIVLLGDDSGIKEGGTIRRTGKVVSVPVGDALIGRVVNALGQPIDDKGPIDAADYRAIESPAPGILDRQPVKQPLQTLNIMDASQSNLAFSLHNYAGVPGTIICGWISAKFFKDRKSTRLNSSH